MFRLMFFGFRNSVRKKSQDNEYKCCCKTIIYISLVIAIIEIAVVALGIKLTMTYSGNLS